MNRLRYSPTALRADFLRAGAGAALTLVPLAAIPVLSIPGAILGGAGVLFVVFGARTWIRARSEIVVTEEALTVTALGERKIAWQDLTDVKLRYYSTKRDRSRGWMQLTLGCGKTTVRLESTLDRFELVAEAASRAAGQRGIPLSAATLENMRALGISVKNLVPPE